MNFTFFTPTGIDKMTGLRTAAPARITGSGLPSFARQKPAGVQNAGPDVFASESLTVASDEGDH